MNAKNFALVGGVVMLVVGALSLIPAFSGVAFGLPILRVEASYGLFPQTNTLFGIAPLFGAGMWLHAIVALVAGLCGYSTARHPVRTP